MSKLRITKGKDVMKVVKGTGDLVRNMPIPVPDALDFFNKLCDTYREDRITRREIAKIESNERILCMEIKEKYNFYYYLFDKLFAEREIGIHKSFEIIDRGIAQDNNDLITSGLRSLGQIVASSPFANIDNLRNLLESDRVVDI